MVRSSGELRASLSDARIALNIALSMGEESAISKRGGRGEMMVDQGDEDSARCDESHGRRQPTFMVRPCRVLTQRGRWTRDKFAFGVARRRGFSGRKHDFASSIDRQWSGSVAENTSFRSVSIDGEESVAERDAPGTLNSSSLYKEGF
jgi:hypothetical protein